MRLHQGRIVRAHNALAYCWLFCFLTVRPIFRLFIVNYLFLFIYICSHRPVGRLLRNFASWTEVAVVLIHWHQIFPRPTPPIKILNAKSWTKIWHLVRPKLSQFWRFWRPGCHWLQKVANKRFWLQKGTFLRERFCLSHFASKSVERCDLQVGWGNIKKVTETPIGQTCSR